MLTWKRQFKTEMAGIAAVMTGGETCEGDEHLTQKGSQDREKCANVACCKQLLMSVLRCARCKKVAYCSKECQLLDWKAGHNKTCVRVGSAKKVNKGGQLVRLFESGACYYETGNYHQAIAAFEAVRALAEEAGNRGALLNAYINLGACYYGQGVRMRSKSGIEQQEAIRLYVKAASIAEELGIRTEQMKIQGSLGACYWILKQYEESKHAYQYALDIACDIGDSFWKDKAQVGLTKCCFGLRVEQMTASMNHADQLLARNLYQRAIEHYKDSKIVAKEIDDQKMQVKACIGLGTCYSALEQHDQALSESVEYETLAGALECRTMQMNACGNSGYSYYRLEQYEAAIQRYERGKALAEQLGDQKECLRLHGEILRCSVLLQGDQTPFHVAASQTPSPAGRKTRKKKKKKRLTADEPRYEQERREEEEEEERREASSLSAEQGDLPLSILVGLETTHGFEQQQNEASSPRARNHPTVTGEGGSEPLDEPEQVRQEDTDDTCLQAIMQRLADENAQLREQLGTQTLKHAQVVESYEQELHKVRQELDRQKEEQDARSECVICFNVSSDLVALLPCGHLCVCQACARCLSQCPMCCASVTQISRIFT